MGLTRDVVRDIISINIKSIVKFDGFFDDFNRPDENLDDNINWTKIGANPDSAAVRSGKVATITGDQNFYAAKDLFTRDHYSEVIVNSINPTQSYFICCVRTTDSNNLMGLFYASGNLILEKRNLGGFSELGRSALTLTGSDRLRIEVNELNELRVYANGKRVIGPLVDGFNAAETRQGFVTRSSIENPVFDNWKSAKLKLMPINGFIPYGTSDRAVLMQCPLTSASIVQECGGTVIGTGTVFHPTKGVTATEGVSSGLEFVDILGYKLLGNDFQISFDVEADYASLSSPSNIGEAGKVLDGTVNYIMTWNANDTGAFGFIRNNLDFIDFRMTSSDTSVAVSTTMADRIGEFKRYTISKKSGVITIYIDKKPISRYIDPVPTPNFFTDMFKRISLLNYNGQLSSVENLTYMKNIVVANRAVETINIPPILSNVGFFGHSFVMTFGESTNTDQIGDSGLISMVQRELMSYGADLNYYMGGVAGGTTINTGGNPLNVLLPAFMASNPSMIVFITGANDAADTGTYDEDTYRADLRAMIMTMMSGTNVPLLVLPNCPTIKSNSANDGPQFVASVASINVVHNETPAWWASVKGGLDGDLILSNYFNITGGEYPLPNMFRGQFNTLNNNLHPGPAGHAVMGKDIATIIKGYL